MTSCRIGSPAVWSSKTAWKLYPGPVGSRWPASPAPLSSDALIGSNVLEVSVGKLLEIFLAVSDGLGIAAEQGGEIVEAAMPEFGGLDGGVASPVVLAERPVEDLHGEFDIRRIGKGNGHGFGPPSGNPVHPLSSYNQSRFREVDSAAILTPPAAARHPSLKPDPHFFPLTPL